MSEFHVTDQDGAILLTFLRRFLPREQPGAAHVLLVVCSKFLLRLMFVTADKTTEVLFALRCDSIDGQKVRRDSQLRTLPLFRLGMSAIL